VALAAALIIATLGSAAPVFAACDPAQPVSCGQVRAGTDGFLYDDAGRFTPRGVSFFLPQFGINPRALRDGNFAAARADGSLAFWLNRARDGLGANMLRVFVELPSRRGDGSLFTPTSPETLHAFALEANARSMRLGLVVQNSATWTMTAERDVWLAQTLELFATRGTLPLLAYLSASNEINNYCGGAARDCFDGDQGYVDGAVDWTARLREAVKRRAPQLLVTVGITTEMGNADGVPAAFNFFRPDSGGRTLAQQTDFLAPHNFGGGAQGIFDDIRSTGYTGPIVLEEFGFPTDPQPRNAFFTEGPPVCRQNPNRPECFETAPFFVEENIRALRDRPYAGAVAWMLADVNEKNSRDSCTRQPSDLWTGLFATGGTYCDGGTYSREPGAPKATAVRVCLHYTGDVFRCEGRVVRAAIYLPVLWR
jgi:hypothetical protein